MIAIRNGGMPAREATAIAIGASIAAVATFPGPSDAMAEPSRKNITGMSPVLPRQMRTAACATRSSVPFSCACVKSSVTPASVRKSCVGKPLSTSLRLMLPRYTPTIHASASARTPTLSVEKQLTIMATTSAPSDNQAKLIRDSRETFVR
jgi:hypothetical protein